MNPQKRDLAQRSRQFRRALLYLAAALLSALLSDWTIEGSASVGLFGQSYTVHDQRSVICTPVPVDVIDREGGRALIIGFGLRKGQTVATEGADELLSPVQAPKKDSD